MRKPDLSKCATLEDYYKQLAMYYCEKYNDLVEVLEQDDYGYYVKVALVARDMCGEG